MKRLFILLGVVALPAAAAALDLTIDEAVARALQLHPDLRSAAFDRIASTADALGAHASLFPAVSASGSFVHAGRRPSMSFMGTTLPVGGEDAVELTGRVDQPVFTGGRLTNEIRRFRIADDVARLRLQAVRRSVIASTREACYEVIRAEALHRAAIRSIAAAQTHRRDAESRVRAGLTAGVEVIRADVRVQQAALDEVVARNRVALARTRLGVLLRLDEQDEVGLLDGFPAIDPAARVEDAVTHALAMRPDLQAARAGLAAERAGVEIARSAYWPGVSAFYAYTWQDDETRSADDSWKIGLAANWEIFNWGRTDNSVRAAGARARSTAEKIRAAEDRVRIEVRETELAIRAAEEGRRFAEARAAAATEDLRISRLRFGEGVGIGAEVIDAESALASAEAARINAAADLAAAVNRYWLVTGSVEPKP